MSTKYTIAEIKEPSNPYEDPSLNLVSKPEPYDEPCDEPYDEEAEYDYDYSTLEEYPEIGAIEITIIGLAFTVMLAGIGILVWTGCS